MSAVSSAGSRPVLVIVTGDPGTGKTTIANACSIELGIPVLSRDTIKEMMFDSLGWSDRAWSRSIGAASFDVMFYCLDTLLGAGSSVILDCNLNSQSARDTLRRLLSGYQHSIFEVVCCTDRKTAFARFKERAMSGDRHPGHDDSGSLDEFRERIGTHPLEPVVINCGHLVIDTTSADVDSTAQTVCKFVKQRIE